MIRQYELTERVRAYDTNADEALINRAYVFSMKAHGTQTRASGDPYFSHPLEVAGILTELKLDSATIATALLHDTIEDTLATREEIERLFGAEVAQLVDGVTKLSKIELVSENSKQAENFRKLLLAMSNDIRVILVKLADRLHNMRTLSHIDGAQRRRRIALETMEVYAPLAERLGMQELKDELEDRAFEEINSDARNSIIARLEYLRKDGGRIRRRVVRELSRTLKAKGISAEIVGREKKPYAIWRKMERNNIYFEQLSDVTAFRIFVEDIDTCYRVLGVVHSTWPMVPGRFKDYISTPKANNYQSLHTTVMLPELKRVEIQIRTRHMDDIAERGVATHWQYKNPTGKADGRQYRWLRELLEILESAADPEEFLEHTKLEMFSDQVFCFTPKGELIVLPTGATPVDFAYAVHTEVGDTCVGAKVNGQLVPLRTQLHHGDQVEIVRSKAQMPSLAWESFVVTGKARMAIRRFIRQQKRADYLELGRTILKNAFADAGKRLTKKLLNQSLDKLNKENLEDLYVDVGQGLLNSVQVLATMFPDENQPDQGSEVDAAPKISVRERITNGNTIAIKGLVSGTAVHLSSCCHPIPGDRIVGILTPGKGVFIHTIDCEVLENFTASPESWLDVSWDRARAKPDLHVARIMTIVINKAGALAMLTGVISNNQGNIINFKITDRHPDFFTLVVDIEVRDVKHLTNIVAALRADSMITSVERARG